MYVKVIKTACGAHSGCELWERLMLRSAENNVPVFLLGAKASVVHEVYKKLRSARRKCCWLSKRLFFC